MHARDLPAAFERPPSTPPSAAVFIVEIQASPGLCGCRGVQAQRVVAALSPKLPPGKPIPMQTLHTVQVRSID